MAGSAWTNQVQNQVIIAGTQGQLLVYKTNPGTNNLIYSISSRQFTDPYGNVVLPGATSYKLDTVNGSRYIAVNMNGTANNGNAVEYMTAATEAGPWATQGVTAVGVLNPGDPLSFGQTAAAGVGYVTGSGNGTAILYGPSADTTGVTDAAAINAYLADGYPVTLLPGLYYVNTPISIPSWLTLQGPAAVSLPNGTPASRIIGTSGISSIVSFSAAVSARLANVVLDGSGIGGTTANGVAMSGACYDIHLDDVLIEAAPHNGIGASGFHHRFTRVTSHNAGNFGANVSNCTDSTFDNCLMFGSNGNNWQIQNCSNTIFTACRAEWSATGAGYNITGTGDSGTVVLAGCTTDHNAGNGFYVNSLNPSTTESAGVVISGGKAHADQGTDAIRIQGVAVPVTVTGVIVDMGQNPNTLAYYPATAIGIGSIAGNAVSVSGCALEGTAAAWAWDATGVVARSGCVGATGANPTVLVWARLADI